MLFAGKYLCAAYSDREGRPAKQQNSTYWLLMCQSVLDSAVNDYLSQLRSDQRNNSFIDREFEFYEFFYS